MEHRRKIILYGKSVLLGTLEASLQRFPELEVVALAPPLPDTAGLVVLHPDGLIFDLQAARPELAFDLFDKLPCLVVVGIDPGSDRVMLCAGKQLGGITALDLVQLFTGSPAGLAAPG
jgi:hypothetical protein